MFFLIQLSGKSKKLNLNASVKSGDINIMIAENTGFNQVTLRWRLNRNVQQFRLFRSDNNRNWTFVCITTENSYIDTVPGVLSQTRYFYLLEKIGIDTWLPETIETSRTVFSSEKLPQPVLTGHSGWMAIYRKAWELTWQGIRQSPVLPACYCYNDYPNNDVSYLWDTCFCSLFQRYAAVGGMHPCMKSLDNFLRKTDFFRIHPQKFFLLFICQPV